MDTTTSLSNLEKPALTSDEELLASLGYKQEFQRTFTPFEVFGMSFSIMGLLPAIASVLFYAIPNGGGPAMVWGWVVANVFNLCVGLSMAELASSAPTSGGLYFWTYSLSSPKWRRLLCWIVGYTNTICNVTAVASVDWGCAVQVMAAIRIGSLGSSEEYEATTPQVYGVFVAIVMAHVAICCLRTDLLARLQYVYVVLNVLLCLTVIIALPIATPAKFRNTAKFALWDFVNLSGWPDAFAFILSWNAPLWTVSGYDSPVHMSEEASNARTAVPWAITLSILIASVVGWAINIVLAFCMGTDLQAIYESDQPMAQIFYQSFGRGPTLVIWTFTVIVQFMMGSSMLLAASRQTFAFSRDGARPFSSWLYRFNKYTKSPINTVIFDGFMAVICGTIALGGSQASSTVFSISLVSGNIAFALPIAVRIIWEENFKPGPFTLGILSRPVAIVSVAFMAFMSVVMVFPASPAPNAQNMNETAAVLGGTMLLCIGWFYFPKYGGMYWFTGPVRNVNGKRVEATQ